MKINSRAYKEYLNNYLSEGKTNLSNSDILNNIVIKNN